MIEEFAPAALIGFVLSGLVIFLGLAQVNHLRHIYENICPVFLFQSFFKELYFLFVDF